MPECIIFDLDNTLAESKQPLDSEMANLLASLLARTCIAVASGGKREQLQKQVADRLPQTAKKEHLYLLPTSGAALYTYQKGEMKCVYEETLSAQERDTIIQALQRASRETAIIDFTQPSYGERIEFRGAQVSLSALGQEAPLEEKKKWDPDRARREKLRAALTPLLPAYEIRLGGTTTIDITKKGVDKAYGVTRLAHHLSLPLSRMLYVGDELGPHGNDEVVIHTGIPTRAVKNPQETKIFISSLLADSNTKK